MMLNKNIAAANRGPLDATYAADRGKGAATPEEARKLTANVKERFQEIGIQWLELGGMVRACLDRRVPEVLGITTLDWMKLCFDKSVPKIYRSLRIVSALDGVPLETLKEISEGNAYELSRLPAEKRKSGTWLGLAENTPNEAFKAMVDEALGQKSSLTKPEGWTEFRLRGPDSMIQSMQRAEQKVCAMLHIDDDARWKAWEAIAALIETTPEEHLVVEMEGEDSGGQA